MTVEIVSGDWIVKLKPGTHPRELAIEVTTACNLRCTHCFRRFASGFREEHMRIDAFEEVLRNAAGSGVRRIALTGWGEPTVHPDFEKVIELCKERGLEVVLNTNGYNLLRLFEVVAEGVDELVVSVDAFTEELYDAIRVGGRLSQVVEGLRKLLDYKRARGRLRPYVKLLYTVNRLNAHEAGALLALSKSLGVNEVAYSYYMPSSEREELDCLGKPECVNLFERSLQEARSKVPELGIRLTLPTLPVGIQRGCPFAQSRALFVRYDGAVTPCVYYSRTWRTKILGVVREVREVVLGNAMEEPLIDIWREKYVKMFYRLSFSKMPSCFVCKLVNFCEKTRSNESDCLGNSPTCAHCPFYHGLTHCPL